MSDQPKKSLIKRIFAKETFSKLYADVRDIFGYRPTLGETLPPKPTEAEENRSQLKQQSAEQAAGPASGTGEPMQMIRILPMDEDEAEIQVNVMSYPEPEPSHISVSVSLAIKSLGRRLRLEPLRGTP